MNADDFGLSIEVNEAVELAHRDGILTSASLMVGAAAAADAVARAKRNPRLAVGLHVAIVDAAPMSAPGEIDELVAADGRFSCDLAAVSFKIAFVTRARAQMEAELAAQFRQYVKFGLALDHVNSHHHMQLHPAVMAQIVKFAREYRAAGLRAPIEPHYPIKASAPAARRNMSDRLFRWQASRLARKYAKENFVLNDHLFGLSWTGNLDETRMLTLMPQLPEGLSELYCHPTTVGSDDGSGNAETDALLSPRVREALTVCNIKLTTFTEIRASRDGRALAGR